MIIYSLPPSPTCPFKVAGAGTTRKADQHLPFFANLVKKKDDVTFSGTPMLLITNCI
jgi:hypothetical protein